MLSNGGKIFSNDGKMFSIFLKKTKKSLHFSIMQAWGMVIE